MATKKIGVLFGMEDTFPWALINEINERARTGGEAIEASAVKTGALRQDVLPPTTSSSTGSATRSPSTGRS